MADQIDIDELVRELRGAAQAMKDLKDTGVTGSSSGKKDTDRLIQALARLGTKFEKTAKTQDQIRKEINDFVDEVDDAADTMAEMEKAAASLTRGLEESAKEMEEQARILGMTDAQRRAHELQEKKRYAEKVLRERRASKEEINVIGQAVLARQQDLQVQKSLEARLESLGDIIGEVTGNVELTQARMVLLGRSLRDLQKRAGELGQAFVRGVGDMAMSTASLATDLGDGAKSFTQFNGLIDSVTGALGEMAQAIPVVGNLLSGSAKLVAEGAKFVLDQLQKMADNFNELGSVGALTGDGLKSLMDAQLESGVSLEVFTKAIKENSGTLAAFSGTVGSGTQKFTKILTPLTKQGSETSAELRRLGFSLEDITDATGGYLALQTRLGRAQNKRESELTQGAAEYAKELDVLSKLTGAQRKDLQAQQEAAQSEGRFRAVLDEMAQLGPAGEKTAKSLLDFQTIVDKRMGPEMSQAIRDVSTGFTNSEAAQKGFNSTAGQLGPIIAQLKSGAISQDEAYRRLQAALGSNIETQRDYAKAMGDEGPFIKLNEVLNGLRGTTINTTEALKNQAAQTKPGNDALVDSTVSAQQEMEKVSLEMQKLARDAMPQATKAIDEFTTGMNKFIREVLEDKLGMTGLGEQKIPAQELEKLNDWSKAASDTKDVLFDPDKMVKEAESREDSVIRQQRANLQLATGTEKAQIYLGEAIDSTAELLGSGFNAAGLDVVGDRLKALGKSGREARVASQVETLRETGRLPPGKAAPGAKPAAPAAPGAKPAAPATTPTAGGAMGANDLRNAGLTLKQGDVQAEGSAVNPRLVALAKRIQAEIPGFSYFSGFNDRFHQEKSPSSQHTKGLAADFALASQPSPEQGQRIVAQLKAMGFNGQVIDEYNNPSGKATAGHIHAAIQAQSGGIFDGPKTGYPATLHGTEAVLPLPEGGRIPLILENFSMQDLVTAVKNVGAAGLGGLPENPAAVSGIGAPIQSFIAPLVTSALSDIENVFSKAGIAPGSAPPAAAAAPALGAAPAMAASGMSEMMSQLTKLVDLQSRSNKISEKLVRVSTN